MDLSPQHLGRYEIDREIGRGGMSVVYRARDPALGRAVALKVLHPHLASRPESRERFEREARAVARLHHPNILEVFDYAPPESERAYIVSELIEGPTLRAFIDEHPLRNPEVAALLMIPIFDALDHAHEMGIVHRDVKPENIMIGQGGQPILMDFGIAQLVDMETLTQTGTILGSPAHMAPEVVDGAHVTSVADTFSAGTVLYWLVCGALPFSGPSPAALFRRILECRFDPVLQRRPTAGKPLARLIEQCLQKEPDARPPRARGVAEQLRGQLQEAGLTELPKELAAFFADPVTYEATLARRVVPAYLAAARKALDGGFAARAMDYLDRVLAHDENHPEARDMLRRIERGHQRRRMFFGILGGSAVASVGAAAFMLWPSPPPTLALEPDRPIPGAAGVSASPPPSAAPSKPPVSPSQLAPPTAPGSTTPSAPPLRPSAPRVRPSRPPTPESSAIVFPPSPPARVRISTYPPNTQILVDGAPHGYVYEVQAADGLLLPAGDHVLGFRHDACEPQTVPLQIRPGQTEVPRVVVHCKPRPAVLRVVSNREAPVRRNADGQILGQTNAEILVPMSEMRSDLRLTVGDPGGKMLTRDVRLAAGKTTTESVDF